MSPGSWTLGESGRQVVSAAVSGSAAGATDLLFGMEVPPNTTALVSAVVIARRPGTTESAVYNYRALIRRLGEAAPPALGTSQMLTALEDDATANVTATIVGNNYQLSGVAPAGKTYNWTVEAEVIVGPPG